MNSLLIRQSAAGIILPLAVLCCVYLNDVAFLQAADSKPGGKPFFETTTLFNAGDAGYRTYRIPSLVITRKGTLLAAVAARYDSHSDWANIDIMLRRSTDGGKTWEPQQIVTDDGQNTVDNATFIVDPQSDKVYLMYQINYERAYLKISEDEGQRWSAPREITSVFSEFRERDGYGWEVIAMGPGHGITLSSGRLVVPVWLSTSRKHRPSIAATIYSDDKGETWRAGDVIAHTTDETPNPSEHVLIELADGRVMSNMRNESPRYRRAISYSPDGASDWTTPQFHEELVEPICMASMTRYSKQEDGSGVNRILFCNPNNAESSQKRTSWGARERRNVTLRMSLDEGNTWPISRTIEPGPSGYSDVAVGPDGTIYVLYESGTVDDGRALIIPQSVSLARFNLDWLTQGAE